MLPGVWAQPVGDQAVTLADAIAGGSVTVGDLSAYCVGLTEAQTEDEEWVDLIVPGSWSLDADLPASQKLADLYEKEDFDFAWIDFTFTPSPGVFSEYEAWNCTAELRLVNEKAQTFHDQYHTGDDIWEYKETVSPCYENGAWVRGKKVYACTICGLEKEEPGEQLVPMARSGVDGIDSLSFPVNYLRRNSVEKVDEFVDGALRFIEIFYATGGNAASEDCQVLFGGSTKLGNVSFAEGVSDEVKKLQLASLTESIDISLVFTPYDPDGAFEALSFTVTIYPGELQSTATAGRRMTLMMAHSEAIVEPTAEASIEPSEKTTEEPTADPTKEPTAEPTSTPTSEPTPEVFSGNVRVELQNKGDVFEGDKVEFKAIIEGNKALVSICWEKLVENEKTHEKEWVIVEKGEKLNIQATKANAAEKYRVALYDANGEVCAKADVAFPKLNHTPGEAVRENEVAATCTAEGHYDKVVYCTVCGAELSRETKAVEKVEHTPGEAVRENEVAATSDKEGSYDIVVYCTVCGKELSRKAKTIAPE